MVSAEMPIVVKEVQRYANGRWYTYYKIKGLSNDSYIWNSRWVPTT
jgi:hypothetical protein